jgi:hypothetical protein
VLAGATGDKHGLDPFFSRRPVENRQRYSLGNVLRGNFEATQVRRNENYSFAESLRRFDVSPALALNYQLICVTIRSEPNFRHLDRSFTALTNGLMKQRPILGLAGANRAGAQILSQSSSMGGPSPVHDPADHHAQAMQPTKRQSSD